MKIETLNVGDIVPAKYNPREITKEALEGLKASIETFGQVDPLIVNKRGNVLVGGHQRLKVLKEIGVNTVECVIVDLDETKEKALNIALNSQYISGEFEIKELEPILKELKFNFDQYEDIRLDVFELDYDLDFLEEDEQEGINGDENSMPEELDKILIKKGDFIELGDHILLCGDSTSEKDVERALNGHAPNLMVTDPPYGVNYEADWRADRKNTKKKEREKNSKIENDDRADWLEAYSLFKGDIAYVWHAILYTDVVMSNLRDAGFELCQNIIWNKNVHALSRSNYHWKHEPCWYAVKKGGERNWKGGRTQTTVWDIKSIAFEKDKTGHPTQKPLEIYERPIKFHTDKGEHIYDPFGGSGTLIIACEKLKRKAISLELAPKFCQTIVQRWVEYTKKDLIKINGEEVEWSEFTQGGVF